MQYAAEINPPVPPVKPAATTANPPQNQIGRAHV